MHWGEAPVEGRLMAGLHRLGRVHMCSGAQVASCRRRGARGLGGIK